MALTRDQYDPNAEFRRRVMEHKKRRGLMTRAQSKFRQRKTPEDLLKAAEVGALGDQMGIRVGGIDRAERINQQVRGEMEEDLRQGGAAAGARALAIGRAKRAQDAMDKFRPPERDDKDDQAADDPAPQPGMGPDDDEGLQTYADPGLGQMFGILDPLTPRRRRGMFNLDNLA